MYTALILDDEEGSRNALAGFIRSFCPDIELVGICSSGEEALERIMQTRPQILFLDVEISKGTSKFHTSFELLDDIPSYQFEVIFVTAYDEYAVKAIQSHAIGYVLKPIEPDSLIMAVNNAVSRLDVVGVTQRLQDLVDQFRRKRVNSGKIWVTYKHDVIPLDVEQIIRLQAQGKYTDIIMEDGRLVTSSKNIGEFVDILDDTKFVKVHRSHLVNLDKIERYKKPDGGWLDLTNGDEIPLSRSGREVLIQILGIK